MRYLLYAALAAALTFFITLPILGVHLNQSAQGLSLTGQWQHCLYAAAVVFIAQLLLPLAIQAKHRLPRNPRFSPAAYIENHRGVVLALLIVAAFFVPVFGSRGAVNVATLALIYVMLGLSLNIVVGYAGLLDLGHVAFYAVGAYCYAILAQHGVGFWTTLPIAALLTGALGLLLGFPVLRLRGDYLAIVTLGFGEIIRILLNNLDSLTNGPKGINNIPKPGLFNIVFTRKGGAGETPFHELVGIPFSTEQRGIFLYLIILGLCLLTLWVINRLLRMPIGRAWEALREDEIACRSLGVNTTGIKLSAFAIGAAFAGLAGAFYAAFQGSVTPDSFTFWESAIMLAIVVLGGMGSQTGVILAALALTIIPEIAREFSQYRMIIFGAVMVLMMIWRPQGLIPAQRPKMELPE
ncbi:LIV-I protein H [Cardiobacterium hominis]|uniref:Branched-chain amino acid ABC transporter, permease protein n=1 Tax=Cardiobacterium hominis (strain ATCC 15826 / DSM 8339 / NCTC 10426 / 6573) TaxID=638300 RepID=C8N7P3_CARH6|nr:high-affinity branched-chain amino acid ABC transporter permease LivM [Cardiobacterium hominis]EEV89349.1 branched-chain amino acid ABC transporter, permease protein [Cardiobacterium hominis ATCC 15826]VEG77134.1 LIV-I protein H [Cardiobacterium hominis]